jgi:hypothetical protein
VPSGGAAGGGASSSGGAAAASGGDAPTEEKEEKEEEVSPFYLRCITVCLTCFFRSRTRIWDSVSLIELLLSRRPLGTLSRSSNTSKSVPHRVRENNILARTTISLVISVGFYDVCGFENRRRWAYLLFSLEF